MMLARPAAGGGGAMVSPNCRCGRYDLSALLFPVIRRGCRRGSAMSKPGRPHCVGPDAPSLDHSGIHWYCSAGFCFSAKDEDLAAAVRYMTDKSLIHPIVGAIRHPHRAASQESAIRGPVCAGLDPA
jgi:hypothetical protein